MDKETRLNHWTKWSCWVVNRLDFIQDEMQKIENRDAARSIQRQLDELKRLLDQKPAFLND